MKHLRVLRVLDWIGAGLTALFALFLVGASAFTVWLVVQQDAQALGAIVPTLLINGALIVLAVTMAVAFVMAARGVERGLGRLSQTAVAVLALASVPLGTIYGLYALWVCWMNTPTRTVFDEASGRPGAREWVKAGLLFLAPGGLMAVVLAVTIPATLSTDLGAIDARWEPIDDTSQRVEYPGCGLTEIRSSTGCSPAQPTSVRTEEVRFPTRSQAMGLSELKGTLHLPEGLQVPRPAVILVHGSGPQDRHEDAPGELAQPSYHEGLPIFDRLADELSARGLVVLQYDKRACVSCYPELHDSPDYAAFRFQLFVDDALAAIDHLASLPEVDPSRIVVIGHSQGASLAPHIADTDQHVAAVVMLAGTAGTFSGILVDQLEGYAQIRAEQWDPLTAWALRLQADRYRDCTGRIDGDYDPGDTCVGGGVTLQALAEYEEMNRTTDEVLGRLDVPLFAIAGTVDLNVPPGELLRIREDAVGRDAEFHLVSGLGHGMRDLLEPTDPPELDDEVSQRLLTFLGSVRAK